jgi:hypothetical protein
MCDATPVVLQPRLGSGELVIEPLVMALHDDNVPDTPDTGEPRKGAIFL